MQNKYLIKIVLLCLLYLPVLQVKAEVTVTIADTQYQFDTAPRLTEVLAPVALNQNWYWPVAALYRTDSAEPEQQRQLLLSQLDRLIQQEQDAAALQVLQSLKRQVQSWRLALRINMAIDFDLARVKPEFNPKFTTGNYILQLSTRPRLVYPFGAIKQPSSLTHISKAAATAYVRSVALSSLAEPSQVWLLQPDGKVELAGVAAWNFAHIEAMPGAQLFFPFKQSVFHPEFEQLNQRLLALAVHRLLP